MATLSNLSPADLSNLGSLEPFTFTISGLPDALVPIWLQYEGSVDLLLVHDGTKFLAPFDKLSTLTRPGADDSVMDFVVMATGGWQGNIANVQVEPSEVNLDNTVFPSLAVNLGAIMGEEPDHIWSNFGALPILDSVGGQNFTVQAGAPNFSVATVGLWNGVDHTSMLALELTTSTDKVTLVAGEDLDPGLDSFAFLLVYKVPTAAVNNRNLASTRDGAGSLRGWSTGVLVSSNRGFSTADHGPAHISNIVDPGSVVGTGWHYALVVVDRTAETFTTFTDLATDSDSIAGYTTLTGVLELTIGTSPSGQALPDSQYAYAAYWAGAKAENLGATEAAAFWQPQIDNP